MLRQKKKLSENITNSDAQAYDAVAVNKEDRRVLSFVCVLTESQLRSLCVCGFDKVMMFQPVFVVVLLVSHRFTVSFLSMLVFLLNDLSLGPIEDLNAIMEGGD